MWMPSRNFVAPISLAAVLLALLPGGLPGTGPWGTVQGQEAQPSSSAEKLLEIFQPLPLEGGVALVPRASLNGVRTIEVRGPDAVVNGAPVTREVLRSWLQDAAPPVLSLLDLSVSQQRKLFGFEPIAPAPAAPAPSAPLEQPPAAEAALAAEEVAPVLEAPEASEAPEVAAERPPPAPPQAPRARERGEATINSDARVSIGKRVVVEKNEIAEDVVVIGSSLVIRGEVLGDALAVGGPVRVDGRVSGDVASVGGTVYLEDEAQVHGNVVSVGGGIERDEAAEVFGELTEVSVGKGLFDSEDWFDFDPGHYAPHWPRPFRSVGRLFGGVTKLVFLALIACLVLLILPQQTRRAERVLAREPWKAGLVGLVALLVYWVVLVPALIIACIVLAITIIGIPVAILLVLAFILFTVAVSLLGYTSAASRLGSWFGERFPGRFENRFVRLLTGILLIEVWLFLASLLDVGGWVLFLPVLFLGIFGWLVEFAAWTMGLGAVLTSWYEGRDDRGSQASPGSPGAPPHHPLPPLPALPSQEELEAEFEAAREDGSADHIFWDEPPVPEESPEEAPEDFSEGERADEDPDRRE